MRFDLGGPPPYTPVVTAFISALYAISTGQNIGSKGFRYQNIDSKEDRGVASTALSLLCST